MPVSTLTILGLWHTLLDTLKALEDTNRSKPAASLIAMLLDLLDGLMEREPDIRRLLNDLQHIGAAE